MRDPQRHVVAGSQVVFGLHGEERVVVHERAHPPPLGRRRPVLAEAPPGEGARKAGVEGEVAASGVEQRQPRLGSGQHLGEDLDRGEEAGPAVVAGERRDGLVQTVVMGEIAAGAQHDPASVLVGCRHEILRYVVETGASPCGQNRGRVSPQQRLLPDSLECTGHVRQELPDAAARIRARGVEEHALIAGDAGHPHASTVCGGSGQVDCLFDRPDAGASAAAAHFDENRDRLRRRRVPQRIETLERVDEHGQVCAGLAGPARPGGTGAVDKLVGKDDAPDSRCLHDSCLGDCRHGDAHSPCTELSECESRRHRGLGVGRDVASVMAAPPAHQFDVVGDPVLVGHDLGRGEAAVGDVVSEHR